MITPSICAAFFVVRELSETLTSFGLSLWLVLELETKCSDSDAILCRSIGASLDLLCELSALRDGRSNIFDLIKKLRSLYWSENGLTYKLLGRFAVILWTDGTPFLWTDVLCFVSVRVYLSLLTVLCSTSCSSTSPSEDSSASLEYSYQFSDSNPCTAASEKLLSLSVAEPKFPLLDLAESSRPRAGGNFRTSFRRGWCDLSGVKGGSGWCGRRFLRRWDSFFRLPLSWNGVCYNYASLSSLNVFFDFIMLYFFKEEISLIWHDCILLIKSTLFVDKRN